MLVLDYTAVIVKHIYYVVLDYMYTAVIVKHKVQYLSVL